MKHGHADTKKHANTFAVLGQYLTALVLIGYRRFAPRMGEELTRITHIEQPFGAELDWYVENVVLPQAHALGDGGALVAWMEQEAAIWRNAKDDPGNAMDMEAHDQAEQSRILARDIALAELLEQLAREVREAPETRH